MSHTSHKDGTALVVFLIVKLAAVTRELADHWRQAESPVIDIDQVDAPLVRCRVIESQGLRLDVQFLVGAGDIELFKVRVALEDLLLWFEMPSYSTDTFELLSRSGRRLTCAFQSPITKSKSWEPSR